MNINVYRLKAKAQERRDDEDESGYLFDIHESMREIVSKYNDTIKGRCAVCLEEFCQDKDQEDDLFTDRVDLVRIGGCFHRFHLRCVHRDWFMPRKSEKDSYGAEIKFPLPEEKRCPICRKDVEEKEVAYIQE